MNTNRLFIGLQNVGREYLDVLKELEENEGEFTEEIIERLAVNEDDFADKINTFNAIIEDLDSQIDKGKLYIKSVTAKNKTKEKTIEYLKNVLQTTLIKFGDQNKTAKGDISYVKEFDNFKIQASPIRSIFIDQYLKPNDSYGVFKTSISVDFKKAIEITKAIPNIKFEFSPDKSILKKKLEAKEIIEGAKIEVNHRIKISSK
jgi:hypothetical protein